MKCEIQWVDKDGNPTPDDNEAIGIVHVPKHDVLMRDGTIYTAEETRHFGICREHVRRLDDIGSTPWVLTLFRK